MKGFTVLLTSVVVASFSLGCAQGTAHLLPSPLSDRTLAEWSVEDHREAARLYELEIQQLEA